MTPPRPAAATVPSPVPLFEFEDLLAGSRWASEVPGLAEQASRWMAELPTEREALTRSARRLSRPSLHPAGIARAGEMGGRALLAGLLWAASDLPAGASRRVFTGAPADHVQAAVGRVQSVVRAGGPTYVKLGQFIATARGILPDEMVDAFSWCRDEVAPLPAGTAQRIVERSLGRPLELLFEHFDDTALAAASIAQVHAARLLDGTDVVVKVRRPGLRRRFEADIRALALAAAGAEQRWDSARAANASGFVELFAELVLEELDFRFEALNMVEIGLAAEHAGLDGVRCPRPMPALVTSRVVVMERMAGVRYTDADHVLGAEVDRQRMLRLGIQGVLEHTLVYGRFHGDLHAGNVLVDADGTLSLVDFGIVGRLTAAGRDALVRLMIGFATDDVYAQLTAAADLGAVPADADLTSLAAELSALAPERGALSLTHRDLVDGLGRVVRVLVRNGFRLPKELVLFLKNLLYLNGFAAAVAPDTDLLGEIEPIFEHFHNRYADAMATITNPEHDPR